MTSHGSKVGKGEGGTHAHICIPHQPRPRSPSPPPRLRLQSAREAGSGAAKIPPRQKPQLLPPENQPPSTCISELEWSATEGDSRPAPRTGSGSRGPPASGPRGGAGRRSLRGWSRERGARAGVGSAGPRRAVLARRAQGGARSWHRLRPPPTRARAVRLARVGSPAAFGRDPAYLFGTASRRRAPRRTDLGHGRRATSKCQPLDSGAPAGVGLWTREGEKGHIWAKPGRVTHGGGTPRGEAGSAAAGRALAEILNPALPADRAASAAPPPGCDLLLPRPLNRKQAPRTGKTARSLGLFEDMIPGRIWGPLPRFYPQVLRSIGQVQWTAQMAAGLQVKLHQGWRSHPRKYICDSHPGHSFKIRPSPSSPARLYFCPQHSSPLSIFLFCSLLFLSNER